MARHRKTKEAKALVNTPAKTLALEEAGTMGGTLSEVDSQELVHKLAHTILKWRPTHLESK